MNYCLFSIPCFNYFQTGGILKKFGSAAVFVVITPAVVVFVIITRFAPTSDRAASRHANFAP